MKFIFICITFIYIIFATSCSQEEYKEIDTAAAVAMNISMRSLDASVKLRIMVADAENGNIIVNSYPAAADPATGDYRLQLRAGKYYFYLLANEPARLTSTLDAVTLRSQLSGLNIKASELPDRETPETESTTSSNIPAFGAKSAVVRAKPGVDGQGEISADNGATWSNILDVNLERLAVKYTFALRKDTPNANDKVTVKKIEIVNATECGNILEEAYHGNDFLSLSPCDNMSGFEFDQNSTLYQVFFSDLIVSEYLMARPNDKDMASTIRIEAKYNNKNVLYHIPIRGDLNVENYSVTRNKHYIIMASITTEGELIYMPEVSYQVADWDDATDNPSFVEETAIHFNSQWANGTKEEVPSRTVYVENNEYLEYYFTLNHPLAATWTATITNPIDFMFDTTGGAVSQGRAKQGVEYKIRIRPRRVTSHNNIKTEFYITVNNGIGNVELNLPESEVGTGNRYTIIQIPD